MKIFQIKNSDIFHNSAQNIDCRYSLEPPRRGGSNEYPQSMFWAEKIKNNEYPCKPQFYYIKVGFKGGQKYIGVFSWCCKIWSLIHLTITRRYHYPAMININIIIRQTLTWFIWWYHLRGLDTLSGEATLLKLFIPFLKWIFFYKGRNLLP